MKKKYKQYFTPFKLAELMVQIIPDIKVENIVDLSMGECGLLEVARNRWPSAKLFGADIDCTLVNKIKVECPYIDVFEADSMTDDLMIWSGYNAVLSKSKFDLVLANPPFDYYDKKNIDIENYEISLPVEIRFLLKYIDVLKDGGIINIVLPYNFLLADSYRELRKFILEKMYIIKVIRIYDKCFESINASTCLMLMVKKTIDDKKQQFHFEFQELNEDFKITSSKLFYIDEANYRLDIEYRIIQSAYDDIKKNLRYEFLKLNDIAISCKRGKSLALNKAEIASEGYFFVHTTNVRKLFIKEDNKIYVKANSVFDSCLLHKGDILISRVGNSCIGRVAVVNEDYFMVASDCLFILTVKNINSYYLALVLSSKFGSMQFTKMKKGSCSKYITKKDLLDIEIPIIPLHHQEKFAESYKDFLLGTKDSREVQKMINLIDNIFKI